MKTKHTAQLWFITMAIAACCVVVCAQGAFAATVYDTAVSYWSFDNDFSDYYGRNDAIPVGTVTIYGDDSLLGDASFKVVNGPNGNNFVNTPLNSDPVQTISFWAKGAGWAVSSHQSYQDYNNFIIGVNYNGVQLRCIAGWEPSIFVSGVDVKADWTHVALVNDNANHYLYVNGQLGGTYSGNSVTGDKPITLGHITYVPVSSYYYDGLIDEAAIWNTALTADQIDALYKTSFIADAVGSGELNLGYTTDQINQIANLYYEGEIGGEPDALIIDDKTWNYYATDPAWAPQDLEIGEYWASGSAYYIKLGSGTGDPGVPEPATVVGLGLMVIAAGLRRMRNSRKS